MSAPREPIDIHLYFGLSYSSYLVLPRSVLQSMPEEWQHRLTVLLLELGDRVADAGIEMEPPGGYRVFSSGAGHPEHDCEDCRPSVACLTHAWEIDDPYADYQRGRRDVFREAAR